MSSRLKLSQAFDHSQAFGIGMRWGIAWRCVVVAAPCFLFLALSALQLPAQEPPANHPVVARVEMKLVQDEKVIDVIEKGDLLTVLQQREDDYVIVTHNGSKGGRG